MALVYPEDAAPRQSAESVRAIFDDPVEAALCHARALLKNDCPLTFMLTNVEAEIALSRIQPALGSDRSKISTR